MGGGARGAAAAAAQARLLALGAEAVRLVVEHAAQCALADAALLEVEVEAGDAAARVGGVGHLAAVLAAVDERVEEAVRHGLVGPQALLLVEDEEAPDEVVRRGRRVGVKHREGHAALLLHGLQEAPRLRRPNVRHFFRARRADDVEDELQLVHEVLAGEERAAPEELCQDAAAAPEVHGVGVEPVGAKHELRRAVPARHDVLRHGVDDALVGRVAPRPRGPLAREPKVRDAQVAVAAHEQVPRLEVAVDDTVLVHEVHAAQQLDHEVPRVRLGERLRRLDDAVQVAVHELHHQVELVAVLLHDAVPQRDDVRVLPEVAHEPQLAQHVLRVGARLRDGRDALDGNARVHLIVLLGVRREQRVRGRGDDAVGAAADGLERRVLLGHEEVDAAAGHDALVAHEPPIARALLLLAAAGPLLRRGRAAAPLRRHGGRTGLV
mmetsp:Transcript_27548/g.87211  ORF Transcript_27548/g.87211 Transcript_27548/m.87211 type:complete len:437 (-) Transcript_27548:485-1795(-)